MEAMEGLLFLLSHQPVLITRIHLITSRSTVSRPYVILRRRDACLVGEHRAKRVVTSARHARIELVVNHNAPTQNELCSGPFSANLRGTEDSEESED
jgi:hypothetical protein